MSHGSTSEGLRVIGAGFGRTGTASLKSALERLGFAPCYHMKEVVTHEADALVWRAAARGQPVDFAALLGGWRAAVDFPAALYYRELMETFPDAKVVLTTRDPGRWYESMRRTIHPLMTRFPNRHVGRFLPVAGAPFRAMGETYLRRDLLDRFGDRAHVLRMFNERNAEVVRTVPPERLLVYDVSAGWEPLCEFLQVPVPDEPFPRTNDTAEFRRIVRVVTVLCWIVLLAPAAALAAILVWLI